MASTRYYWLRLKKDFFTDKCRKSDGTPINGSKYFNDYDFVPDITDSSWDDYKTFIDNRREEMIQYLKNRYIPTRSQ